MYLQEGGELYFSDIYSSKAVPEHLKQDPVLWGKNAWFVTADRVKSWMYAIWQE